MIHVLLCNLLKDKHNSGLLPSVDFKTELDSLSWSFIQKIMYQHILIWVNPLESGLVYFI